LIRALAIRTMGYLYVDQIIEALAKNLQKCLEDRDPYVAKTAAVCVTKLYAYDRSLVERMGFLDQLRNLLNHENSTVMDVILGDGVYATVALINSSGCCKRSCCIDRDCR
jgi:vesicle coat complex subunit